ncbi:flagellar hook-associated protein FlgK [Candidatus Magnetoovum chiemensis]|nr:flagellar hook-associated protein FlgK [Candidatus Magnetoovum chiemensis]
MALTGLFDIGRSALVASRLGLEVTGNNIANVNNKDYSRQEVILEVYNPIPTSVGTLGRGVSVKEIERHIDTYLETQLRIQNSNIGKSEIYDNVYGLVEDFFNEQKDFGLSSQMEAFFNAWNEISAEPNSDTQRATMLIEAQNLLTRAQEIEDRLIDIRSSLDEEIPAVITNINELANDILYYNREIAALEAGGLQNANDLRDKRDGLLKELSALIDINVIEDDNGQVLVQTGTRNLVDFGQSVHEMDYDTSNLEYTSITIDNIEITNNIKNGRLGALLALKNNEEDGIPGLLSDMRKLTAAITNEVNIIHSSGFGLNASAADFTLTDNTPATTTTGAINSLTISDYNNFTPGYYNITFTSATTYDVYRNGTLESANNTYAGSTINLNGMNITFSTDPANNDTFNIAATGKDLFQPLSVYTVNQTPTTLASVSTITSAAIYDRTALQYKEYELTFTNATTYTLYDIRNNTTTTGTLNANNSALIDGMEITFSTVPPPAAGHKFLISPIAEAISKADVIITDPSDVAASATSTGTPGDNNNALEIIALADKELSVLSSSSINDYYYTIVAKAGGLAKDAKDQLAFEQNLQDELQLKRDSLSAVSLDEEAMNLIRYQKAFEAASRLIQTADDILGILVNLGMR